MAQNYSDSEDSNIEFTGFNSEDIVDEIDFYVPDSEPDSDISVSTVHSSDISNLGEESGESGNETNDGNQQAEWTQNFEGISINAFEQTSGPLLPDGFDVATASPLDYFELLFKPRIFNEIKTYMNNYALFCQDQK